MDPTEPVQLIPTQPLLVRASESLPPPPPSPKASAGSSVDRASSVGTVSGLTGYALISTMACQAIGSLAVALVTSAAACTLM